MLSEVIYENFENSFYEYGENRDLCLKIILNSEKAEDIIDFYCEGKTDDFEDELMIITMDYQKAIVEIRRVFH